MIIFSIIFAPLFTLLTIWAIKNSTDEWGDPFKIKIIYIMILFFFLLIPVLNIMIAATMFILYCIGLAVDEIKPKRNNKLLNKILNFLNKEI